MCLGLVKKVIDADGLELFTNKRKDEMRRMLLTYDLPCSLALTRILFDSGSYDQSFDMAERVLAIEPQNELAKEVIRYIKHNEKDDEWRRLKDASDIHEYVREAYTIQKEREDKKRRAMGLPTDDEIRAK